MEIEGEFEGRESCARTPLPRWPRGRARARGTFVQEAAQPVREGALPCPRDRGRQSTPRGARSWPLHRPRGRPPPGPGRGCDPQPLRPWRRSVIFLSRPAATRARGRRQDSAERGRPSQPQGRSARAARPPLGLPARTLDAGGKGRARGGSRPGPGTAGERPLRLRVSSPSRVKVRLRMVVARRGSARDPWLRGSHRRGGPLARDGGRGSLGLPAGARRRGRSPVADRQPLRRFSRDPDVVPSHGSGPKGEIVAAPSRVA